MANADSTTRPSQPSFDDRDPEGALISAANLDGALGEIRLAIEKVSCLELQGALCAILAEAAKLAGVLEWLGEGLLVLPERGAE